MFNRLMTVAVFASVCLVCSNISAANTRSIEDHPKIDKFINKMVTKHQFNRNDLKQMFAQVKVIPAIIESMNKPAESLPWHRYQKIFLKETRITQGVEFWALNEAVLRRAEAKYGVPAEIIVAIIGVETRYGRNKGGHKVLDSLTTLVVDYPRRSKFFSKEMEEFLLLARNEKLDPLQIEGSYAGAMGKPQFMPSSYRRYAVDFDGNGVRDLLDSSDDAIGSVANYLSRHGWQRAQPVAKRAEIKGKKYAQLVKKGLKPHIKVSEVKKFGVRIDEGLSSDLKTALIELKAENGKEYWLGLTNFYAITRYNHSALYAMAVFQLAQAVSESRIKIASSN